MSSSAPLKSKSTDPQTPDIPPATRRPRLRNRHAAVSLKEVRQVAQGNRDQTDQIVVKSARRHISYSPPKNPAPKLPAKYEMLVDFFHWLMTSIRLLQLKGYMSTFTNISPLIACLSDRRFSHQHLAQLMYIMPEVIEVKREDIMLDERTCSMKPDLCISINVDAVEFDGNLESLTKNFQLRLVDFYKAHPQGDEIPEKLLPEPFNRKKQDQTPNSSSSTETSTDGNVVQGHKAPLSGKQQPAVIQGVSVRRHFSLKSTPLEPLITQQNPENRMSSLNKISSTGETSSAASSPTEVSPSCPVVQDESSSDSDVPIDMSVQCATATPRKAINSLNSIDTPKKIASDPSTPAKSVLTPTSMSRTPSSRPQKRSCRCLDDSPTSPENKLGRRDDVLECLAENLQQSIRETERKTQEERDPAISQAKRRRQMIARLPKLFNTIHSLLHSINRSVITKKELMYKIITSHIDVVDSREVEEQLNLLLELVPEWISQKLTSSEDLLVRINKMSSAETIGARLQEAK
ncbi:hypothetical protein M5689_001404 [Euphorbia peplus]|nr:hypothetical protein M5689_001404 [Euphorbia peplus]